MNSEVIVESDYGKPRLVLHPRMAFDSVAGLAVEFIKAPGSLLLGVDEGQEDSAGRAKARPCTATELASRAFDIAQAVHDEAIARGHMLEIPSWNEMEQIAQEKRGKN
jgi:hypothetical protein